MKPEDEMIQEAESVTPETAAEAVETVNTDEVSPEITNEAPGELAEVAPVTDAVTEEAPAEETPAEVKTLAMRLIEALKDDLAEGATEDEMVSTVSSLLEYRTKNREANARLVAVFENNPEILKLIRLLDEGATLVEALPYVVDVENLVPVEGEPEFEKWNAAKSERAAKSQGMQAETDEILNNLDMSAKQIGLFAEKNGLTPEAADEFISTISSFIEEASMGKITEPTLTRLYKGITFDDAIAETEEIATIKGRNDAIDDMVTKDESMKGDGLPNLASAQPTDKRAEPEDPWSKDLDEAMKRSRRFN